MKRSSDKQASGFVMQRLPAVRVELTEEKWKQMYDASYSDCYARIDAAWKARYTPFSSSASAAVSEAGPVQTSQPSSSFILARTAAAPTVEKKLLSPVGTPLAAADDEGKEGSFYSCMSSPPPRTEATSEIKKGGALCDLTNSVKKSGRQSVAGDSINFSSKKEPMPMRQVDDGGLYGSPLSPLPPTSSSLSSACRRNGAVTPKAGGTPRALRSPAPRFVF